MQLLHVFVLQWLLNIHRGHWAGKTSGESLKTSFYWLFRHLAACPNKSSLFSDLLILSLGGIPSFLCREVLLQLPLLPSKPRHSSDKTVILLNNAKFVQASSGAPCRLFGHWRRNFPLCAFPVESSFLLLLFQVDVGHAVRVTVFLSRKYWCICERMLTCTLGGFVFSYSASLQNDTASASSFI